MTSEIETIPMTFEETRVRVANGDRYFEVARISIADEFVVLEDKKTNEILCVGIVYRNEYETDEVINKKWPAGTKLADILVEVVEMAGG